MPGARGVYPDATPDSFNQCLHPRNYMIIGYQLSGPDNGTFWYRNAPADTFCAECHSVIDASYAPHSLERGKFNHSLTYTYDGKAIANRRFAGFCRDIGPGGVALRALQAKDEVFEIMALTELPFAAAKRNTKFIERCDTCGSFVEVVGASPGFIAGHDDALPSNFFRTDILFGRAEGKHPLLIVGPGLRQSMLNADFSDVDFYPIYGESTTLDSLKVGKFKRN